MNIERLLKNERLILALTGLNSNEFKNLLPLFTKEWHDSKIRQHFTNSTNKRAIGAGRKGFLEIASKKLFFILFYYKCYPTYDVLGFIFDCNRSNAFHRREEMGIILESVLGKKLVLPERQLKSIEDFLKAFPEAKEIFIDGTERPTQRPKDKDQQKNNYSGKKKRHTKKNIIITDKNKRVGFLSDTANGKEHDFTLLKEYAPPDKMPPKITKHLDLGFKGFDSQFPDHEISMPTKKSRNKELSELEKEQNKNKSSIRVLVENALAGVKRLRITTDVFRNRKKGFDDQAILISCGLWNYHLSMK